MVERSKLSKTVTLNPSVQRTAVVAQAQPHGAASADCPALSAWWGAGMELRVPKDCTLLLLWALMPTWCLRWAPARPRPPPPVTLPDDTRLQFWRSCLQTFFRRLCLRVRVPTLLAYVVRMLSSRSSALHFPQILLLLSL